MCPYIQPDTLESPDARQHNTIINDDIETTHIPCTQLTYVLLLAVITKFIMTQKQCHQSLTYNIFRTYSNVSVFCIRCFLNAKPSNVLTRCLIERY